jgi:hypothetical protein
MSKLRTTLTAGLTALSAVFALPAAQAQETAPTNAAVGIPAERQVVTAEEALELSRPSCDTCPGRVVLHVGEDFNEFALRALNQSLSNRNFTPVIVYGNENQMISAFVSGGTFRDESGIPKKYDWRESDVMIASVITIITRNNLRIANIQNNDID